MAGLGLSDLDRPSDPHNPALDPRFERRTACHRLDRASVRALIRASELEHVPFDREQVILLARKLDYSRDDGPPESRASRLFYGAKRMHVGGAQWQLIDR